ncbi:hypothetical protein BDV12DRAFT_159311 [Aspergillus spectabilis]
MEILTTGPEYAAEDDYQMALTTAHFEREYNQVHARTVQLLDAERGRMHCMEQLLLRIENESLQLQINQTGQELIQAREAESEARLQLDGAIRELELLQGIAQTSSRELEYLRRELASLNAVAAESQKLQADKVRLSKEVSSLQAEIERLGTQKTSANALLSEKQALTRQLNALEVQLENEKRTHERTLAKESQQTEEVAALTLKLEEARREIDLAHRHRLDNTQAKGRIYMTQQSPVAGKTGHTHRTSVFSKDRHREDTPTRQQQDGWSSTTTKVPTERPSGNLPKLTSRLHSELTIATPGAIRAQDQQKRFSTLPGDKSSFSITPFLNRTTGLEESSSSDDELNDLNSVVDSGGTGRGTNITTRPKQLKQPTVKQLYNPGKQGPAKVALDGDTRNKQNAKIWDSTDEAHRSYQAPQSHPVGQKQQISKKRKLGLQRDKSLFDEDEEDNSLHDTRKLGRKLVGTGQASSRVFTDPLGFSPLKRDKKRF